MIKKHKQSNGRKEPCGQGIVEYLLVFSVVILLFLAVLRPDGLFHKSLNDITEVNTNSMVRMSKKIFNNIP